MQNKNNRWLDVQIVIVSLALTFSLALWNLFAGKNQSANSKIASSPPKETILATPTSQPTTVIYLGGPAPKPYSYSAPAAPQPSSSSNTVSNSPPASAPAPVTTTGSSHP